MSVLVTGGAGFIGSHVVERLLTEGHRVLCLDDLNDFYDPAIRRRHLTHAMDHLELPLIEGNIRDGNLVNDLFETEHPERVVHLAARAGVRASLQEPSALSGCERTGYAEPARGEPAKPCGSVRLCLLVLRVRIEQ